MLPIERDVREIERFDSEGRLALSLYLDLRSSSGKPVESRIAAVLRPIASQLTGAEARALDDAAYVARRAVLALAGAPRAVAAFSCVERQFLKVVPLPNLVEPTARWEPRLHIGPLLSALDENERTLVILVDERRARVLRLFMGEIAEIAHVNDSNGAGGAAAAQWHVRRHLARVLEAFRQEDASGTDRILLGGSQVAVHELLQLMPQRLRARTRLVAGVALGATLPAILDRVTEIQRQAEREGEEELLDYLVERIGTHAVFGTAAVLEAVADARVHTLVYGASSSMEGSECAGCGWLMPVPTHTACPRCGETLVSVPDLVERIISRVLLAGGRVEEVRGPALKTLTMREGLAALLRYTPGANRSLAAPIGGLVGGVG